MAAGKQKSPTQLLEALFGADALATLTGTPITGEEVEFHDGPKIILPNGMTYEKAYEILERLQRESETTTEFNRRFMFRANDGAYATLQVIKKLYGMVLGKATWFQPATSRTISISPNETIQVPWGQIEIPVFPGLTIVLCDSHHDKDYGAIFEIHAMGPKKYESTMEEIFKEIDAYLRTNSIYRGRAIIGSASPEFLDLSGFRPEQVVFSDEATAQLEGLLHNPIRYADKMRAKGLPLKRAVLLEGPFGTGKTSEGMILAQVAVESGWTFISAKPGRDKVEDVLRTAKLYQPAVVFIEDIDGETSSGEADDVTLMLDAFDGITAKGGELIAVMTTNHVEKIHKGMLRPGRLDAVVHIGSLDRNGIERLVKVLIPSSELAADTDFDKVGEAMTNFYPAFVKEAANRSRTIAIGNPNAIIGTDELVTAAQSLHAQLDQLESAGEGTRRPGIEKAMGDLVTSAVQDLIVFDPHRQISMAIQPKPEED